MFFCGKYHFNSYSWMLLSILQKSEIKAFVTPTQELHSVGFKVKDTDQNALNFISSHQYLHSPHKLYFDSYSFFHISRLTSSACTFPNPPLLWSLKEKIPESVYEWRRDVLCRTKGVQPPKNMVLYTERWNMIYGCVIYVQTQYVDLYIIWSLPKPTSLALGYKDIVRGRKDIRSRDFTQCLRAGVAIGTLVCSSVSETAARNEYAILLWFAKVLHFIKSK
jgi:hypothetical protein